MRSQQMKPNLILPLAAAVLLLLLSATTSADTNSVLDIYGHPLKENTNYHVIPVFRGRGGGLTLLGKNDTESCPLYVGQDWSELSNGLPLKIFPVNPEQNIISTSTDLNLVFNGANICEQSTGWRLTLEEDTGRRLVGIGGSVGNPGEKTISNWFKIEKAGTGKSDYKIVFCPNVCDFCKVLCGDLGVFIDQDRRRLLGFTSNDNNPLLVNFINIPNY